MKILGIDPGLARLGWGIVSEEKGNQKVVSFGCIETPKIEKEEKRLQLLFGKLKKIIEKYKPDVLAIEDLFFGANLKTASRVGQARGVILLTASLKGLPIKVYTPLKVKMALVGYGRAEKHQVQQMVKTILRLDKIPEPDDTADALAVALTHCFIHKFEEAKLSFRGAKRRGPPAMLSHSECGQGIFS